MAAAVSGAAPLVVMWRNPSAVTSARWPGSRAALFLAHQDAGHLLDAAHIQALGDGDDRERGGQPADAVADGDRDAPVGGYDPAGGDGEALARVAST
jgi:hypothetical protein